MLAPDATPVIDTATALPSASNNEYLAVSMLPIASLKVTFNVVADLTSTDTTSGAVLSAEIYNVKSAPANLLAQLSLISVPAFALMWKSTFPACNGFSPVPSVAN